MHAAGEREKPYVLRLPKGTAERFAENFAKVAPHERLTFNVHKVKRGDTLSRHRPSATAARAEAILQVNRLKSARALRVNAGAGHPGAHGARASGGDAALARKVAQARRSGVVALRPEEEVPAGTPERRRGPGPRRAPRR